jgi:hypothetical protein
MSQLRQAPSLLVEFIIATHPLELRKVVSVDLSASMVGFVATVVNGMPSVCLSLVFVSFFCPMNEWAAEDAKFVVLMLSLVAVLQHFV